MKRGIQTKVEPQIDKSPPKRINLTPEGNGFTDLTDSKFGEFAMKVKPEKGFVDVIAHGDEKSIQVVTTKATQRIMERSVSPDVLVRYLKRFHDVKNANFRLISCKTGALNNGFAAEMMNASGGAVKAPTDLIWVGRDGDVFITAARSGIDLPVYPETGTWKIFKK